MSSSPSMDEETLSPTNFPIYTKASENICMWKQQSSDACDSPRSCYDCLNSSPGDEVECVITSAGLCTTMHAYVWQEDYRITTSNAAPHYFPSSNTTYCNYSDPVCVSCRENKFIKSASGTTKPSQYCVGSNSCVCVGYCESPVYAWKVANTYCTTSSSLTLVNVIGISVGDIIIIVILCFTIPVIAYLWWVRRLQKRRVAHEEAYRNRRPINGPLLSLVGWKKYCADLMANQMTTVGVNANEDVLTTPTAAATQNSATEASNDVVATPLTNLQIAAFSIEFEDPQHPLTAVTRTGRRRSSIDNTHVVRARPSQPNTSNQDEADDDDEVDENNARTMSYAPLESAQCISECA